MILRLQHALVAGLLLPPLFAAAGEAPSFAPRVERWGVQELTLRSSRTYDNPFADVSIQGRFRSQGKDITVDGFYDGDHTWKIRFMPETSGTWTFTTVSTDADLNDKSGSFLADNPGAGNHGPVVVRTQYHFAYADGTPYFPLGTTLYNWLNRSRDLEIRTLSTLSRNPFNKVRFLVFPKWMVFNRVDRRGSRTSNRGPESSTSTASIPSSSPTTNLASAISMPSESKPISFCSTPTTSGDSPAWTSATTTPT